MNTQADSIAAFQAIALNGKPTSLADYLGQVLLVVNTASQCGFTPQYEQLQMLHEDYRERGFAVLGFPCNQFGGQEPGTAAQIGEFCQLNYGVDFPLFAKVEVNGPDAHPLFQWLKQQAPGVLGSQAIKWNFTKFLIDRDGRVVSRHSPTTKPAAIRTDIEALLQTAAIGHPHYGCWRH